MRFKGARYSLRVSEAANSLRQAGEVNPRTIKQMEQVLSNDFNIDCARTVLGANAACTSANAVAMNVAHIVVSRLRLDKYPDISKQDWVRFAVAALTSEGVSMDAALINLSDLLENARIVQAELVEAQQRVVD